MKIQLPLAFLTLILSGLLLSSCATSQDHPFASEIRAFQQADKDSFPPPNAILFTGSSSFRMWDNLQADFPGLPVVNRAFGGAQLTDLIFYAKDVIIPYKPRQIVIYCGDNDLASADSVTSTVVLKRFIDLFQIIRSQLPTANIVYVSIKPSPSRRKLMPAMEEVNVMIRQFLSGYENTSYVDIYHPMLDPNGQPRGELFRGDSLHMNEKGYAIWKEAIRPHLK